MVLTFLTIPYQSIHYFISELSERQHIFVCVCVYMFSVKKVVISI